jgi:hypothetical protein
VEAARLGLSRGDPTHAAGLIEAALATIGSERDVDPEARDLQLLEGEARVVAGQLAALTHDTAAARAQWMHARDALAPAMHRGADPNFVATMASAHLLLDDTAAASPLLGQLAAMGYRTRDLDALLVAKKQPYELKSAPGGCGVEEAIDAAATLPPTPRHRGRLSMSRVARSPTTILTTAQAGRMPP